MKTMKKISLLLSSLSILLISFPSRGEIIDRIVAVVNSESITLSEIRRESLPAVQEIKNKYSPEKQKDKIKEIESKILDELIKQKLQIQKAKEQGITVSEENVTAAIEEQKKTYSMNDEQFKESLNKENVTLSEYRQKIRDQITIISLINHVVKPKIFFTAKEFTDYYNTNIDFFRVPETINLKEILVRIPEGKSSFDMISLDFEVSEIFKGKENDEGLASLAEKLKRKGISCEFIDMGVFKKEDLSQEFAKTFSMAKGSFSLIKSEGAYHIIEIADKKSESIKPFTEVKDEIEDILYNKKRDKIYQEYLKELEQSAYIEKRNLD
ncbi:MAG: hypothetical protein A2W05_06010 [Candidatus Schekmanbacteria bacterium RBG_16_38_10]|uniref:PpiC domain-containing protein n=1 Tax=Candidatus Schekmanbacteria bacterium RBG_16_38_10 TaxID=1817879 RepID=A0A1F7RZE2_9BACT|nr:MAG: hypothetical protein A2W05_06010 [Candidatus Schekmanbacteria bacterium RBG_16_38_10]